MDEWVGDPEVEVEFLSCRSPLTYIQNVSCPILIILGANDPRVVKHESDQTVDRLRSKRVEVEYLVFPEEGHGFTRKKNQFAAYQDSV
jgi:dipeptidyl aminopeptidase/acylaminoacyl peptidase